MTEDYGLYVFAISVISSQKGSKRMPKLQSKGPRTHDRHDLPSPKQTAKAPDNLPFPIVSLSHHFFRVRLLVFRKDNSQNLLPRKPPVFSPQGLLVGHGTSDFPQKHDLHMQITSAVCTPFKIKGCAAIKACDVSISFLIAFCPHLLAYTKYIQIYPNVTK